jgi:hypothetical protein
MFSGILTDFFLPTAQFLLLITLPVISNLLTNLFIADQLDAFPALKFHSEFKPNHDNTSSLVKFFH